MWFLSGVDHVNVGHSDGQLSVGVDGSTGSIGSIVMILHGGQHPGPRLKQLPVPPPVNDADMFSQFVHFEIAPMVVAAGQCDGATDAKITDAIIYFLMHLIVYQNTPSAQAYMCAKFHLTFMFLF